MSRRDMKKSIPDFMGGLYYDREELLNEASFEEGQVEKTKEIAQAMLKENLSVDIIEKVTGLSKENILEIKNKTE